MTSIVRTAIAALLVALCALPVMAQSPEAIVAQALAKFPADAQRIDMLLEATRNLNAAGVQADNGQPFGLLRKQAGHNICRDGQCFSVDVVCAGNGAPQEQYDVVRDGPVATWGKVREPLRRDVCEVFESGPGPDPGPGPTPEPPPDLAPIYEHLSKLDSYVSQLNLWALEIIKDNQSLRQRNAEQDAVIANMLGRLEETERNLPVRCRFELLGLFRIGSCVLEDAESNPPISQDAP